MEAYLLRLADWTFAGSGIPSDIGLICQYMHHGIQYRIRDDTITTSIEHFLHDSPDVPFHLTLNRHNLAHAFYNKTLFVSEQIKQKLQALPNLEFQKAVIDKVIDVPWKHGDVSMVKGIPQNHDMEKFYKKAKAVSGDPESIVGTYYEVAFLYYRDNPDFNSFLIKEILDASFFRFTIQHPFSMKISVGYLEKYPISYCSGALVLSPEAWAILGEHLAVPYYEIRRITVDDSGKASVEKIEMPRTWPCEEDAASPQESDSDSDESQDANDEEGYDEGEIDPELERIMTEHLPSISSRMDDYMETRSEINQDEFMAEAEKAVEAEDFSDVPDEYDLDDVKNAIIEFFRASLEEIEDSTVDQVRRVFSNLRYLPQSLDSEGLIFPPEGKSAQDYYNELMAGEVEIIRKRDKLEDNDVYIERLMEVEKEAFEKVYPRLKAQWQVRQKGLKIFKRGFPSLKMILDDMGCC